MPTDILWTEDLGMTFDETGDIATVTGEDNVIQQISLDTFSEVVALRGGPTTKTDLQSLRTSLRSSLADLEYVDQVQSITFDNVSIADDDHVDVTVNTTSDSLSFSFPP